MKQLLPILFILSIPLIIQYVRFKLTKWEKVVELFGCTEEPSGKPLYGYWSEFHLTATRYPLGNTFLKVIPTFNGLYLKYELKYEFIKYYKPIYVPWENILIEKSSDRIKYDKYHISYTGRKVGILHLQTVITEGIENEVERYKLNFL